MSAPVKAAAVKAASAKAPAGNAYLVEVRLRPDFADADGASALALLQGCGITAREVRTSLVYEVRGPVNSAQVQQAARELLCDAVTQEFRLLSPTPAAPNGMN